MFWFGIMLLITGGMFRVFYEYHQNWQAIADLTFGVVEGRPHWRAFQNRLLAPYLTHGVHNLGLSRLDAVIAVTALLLLIHNLVFYALLRRAGQTPMRANIWLMVFAFMFLVFQDHRWFLPWDAVEMIVVTLTAYVLFFNLSPFFLYPLFLVALLNRESALFIAVMIGASGLSLWSLLRLRLKVEDWRHLVWATVFLAGGALATKGIRDALFIESPIAGLDLANKAVGNHFRLFSNLYEVFVSNLSDRNILFTAALVLFAGLLIRGTKTAPEPKLRGTLFAFLFLIGVMIFGVFNETRMLIPLIPFFVFYCISEPRLI